MHSTRNKQAFTLIEVIISAVIFTITALGTFATISAFRQPAAVSERKLTAAYYGRQILEDLRTKVDQRTWPGKLAAGTYTLANTVIGTTTYSASYTVTDYQPTVGSPSMRKVTLTITWNEP